MGLKAGKADVVNNIPSYNAKFEEWLQWHKDLKSNFGRAIANNLWLKAWRIRGNSSANTSDLRSYLKGEGIKLSTSTWDDIVDIGGNIGDFIGTGFQVTQYVGIGLLVIIVGGLGMAVYNIAKSPVEVINAASKFKKF